MKDDDFAVSPVIGTILLVAITIVLVAIIAAVVMGMSGNVSTKNVGLTVTPGTFNWHDFNALTFTIILHGGKDMSQLRYLNISLDGIPMASFVQDSTSSQRIEFLYPSNPAFPPNALGTFHASELAGQPLYYMSVVSDEQQTEKWNDALYVVTGTFADGTVAVLAQGRTSYETPSGKIHPSSLSLDVFMEELENGGYSLSPFIIP